VLFSFLVSFYPPSQLPVGSPAQYVALVIIGTVVFCAIPLLIHAMRHPDWASASKRGAAEVAVQRKGAVNQVCCDPV